MSELLVNVSAGKEFVVTGQLTVYLTGNKILIPRQRQYRH